MYFDVKREEESGLRCKSYRFFLNDRLELQLESYRDQSRATKRHHYRGGKFWNRLRSIENTIKEKPVIESDILAEAVALAKAAITVI